MSMELGAFPLLPRDTAYVANAVFGKRHLYLIVGDHLPQILTEIDLSQLGPFEKASDWTLALCSLVTVLQYVENLPDRRAAEASRIRADWKYILRLPHAYPGFDHRLLHDYRQHLLRRPQSHAVFQQLLDRLADTGLWESIGQKYVQVADVLETVCIVSELERLIEALYMALEAVASVEPEWLLAITPPHWYERYHRVPWMRVLPRSRAEQVALTEAVGVDARYLLDALHSVHEQLASLPEVQALQQVWQQQFQTVGRVV